MTEVPQGSLPGMPERPPGSAADNDNRPLSAVTTNCCDAWWTGLLAAHCSKCHNTFTSVAAFDIHRRGDVCLDPVTIPMRRGEKVLVEANKPWPGWSKPGTWRGGRDE